MEKQMKMVFTKNELENKKKEYKVHPDKIFGTIDLRDSEDEITDIEGVEIIEGNLNLFGKKYLKSLGELIAVQGDVDLRETNIKSLLNLEHIGGNLELSENIEDLGNLEYVGGNLNLWGNKSLESLRKLKRINGSLNLVFTNIEDLGDLEYVGGNLLLSHNKTLTSLGKLKEVKGSVILSETKVQYFGELKTISGDLDITSSRIGSKYSDREIREKINIEGDITIFTI